MACIAQAVEGRLGVAAGASRIVHTGRPEETQPCCGLVVAAGHRMFGVMLPPVKEDRFFEKLSAFAEFGDVVDEQHYRPAPSNWWVVVGDVVGSTKAIESGRYKDVNTVGAATIAAIKTALGGKAFPFVFGGDGATALIEEQEREVVAEHLHALRSIARKQFRLGLRVGMVQVRELEERGCPVLLAKFRINPAYSLAMFSGGGITLAEELIKGSGSYEIPTMQRTDTDLANLSCRWEPLQPQRGLAVALLVRVNASAGHAVYRSVLEELAAIVGDLEMTNPVHIEAMRYRPLAALWKHDRKHQNSFWLRAKRMLQSAVATLLFRMGLYRGLPKLKHYVKSTPMHADYRKFDDMLRMVIDCTEQDAKAVESLLKKRHAAGEIVYGLHRSKQALMTCHVQGFGDGQHIHFIDGGDGGYAMAAKQLKAQLAQ